MCPDAYWKPLVEELASEIANQPLIIYVDSKKTAIDLTTSFNQHTCIKTAAYTGEDTSKSDKSAVISNWSEEEVTLVIATSAFGLGINKDNIRKVYHLGVPDCLESWMQQAGRGGRDGSICTGKAEMHQHIPHTYKLYSMHACTSATVVSVNFCHWLCSKP